MSMLETALGRIKAQQPKEHTPVWMVGEQLKDMLLANPQWAEMLAQDLEIKEMSLAKCEKKIKAYADMHKTGNFACVTPLEAESIIREFYGLHDAGPVPAPEDGLLRFEDFFP